MNTRVIEIDSLEDNSQAIQDATLLLKDGQLVAIPTETVYGLGADALNPDAVARVFETKQRPSFDPLIIHLASARDLPQVTRIPQQLAPLVEKLTSHFWPGPLTLVLPKADVVPDIVTSGLPTVAVRLSAHPVMRALAKSLGHPIAAPSANQFGRISPTSARAVKSELDGLIPLILDAGACSEGLESTIILPTLDAAGNPAIQILRPGPITRDQLKKIAKVLSAKKSTDDSPSTPGQLASHYAPRKPFFLLSSPDSFSPIPGNLALISLTGDPDDSPYPDLHDWARVAPLSPGSGKLSEAAVRLFAIMRQLDEDPTIDAIYAEPVSSQGLGAAIMDRLTRAAHSSSSSPSDA